MEDSLMSFLKISNITRTGPDNRVQTNEWMKMVPNQVFREYPHFCSDMFPMSPTKADIFFILDRLITWSYCCSYTLHYWSLLTWSLNVLRVTWERVKNVNLINVENMIWIILKSWISIFLQRKWNFKCCALEPHLMNHIINWYLIFQSMFCCHFDLK